jgi:hypothetical protein
MHTDENKKFDKRNIARNIKDLIITQKDYEIYLFKLPDVREKLFNPDESLDVSNDLESKKEVETPPKKKGLKKKMKRR